MGIKKGYRWFSNSPCFVFWRTQLQPIRTAAELTAKIKIESAKPIPLYQKHAQKVTELRLLGLPYQKIADSLGISLCVAEKAYRYYQACKSTKRKEK
ncbi:MAG: hypothetical protein HQL30_06405 [Candidatus Omnitrophica bacterium]|nr:hypothetical protein [Candidatus Omnitrophota bacterium]